MTNRVEHGEPRQFRSGSDHSFGWRTQASRILTKIPSVKMARQAYWDFRKGKLPRPCFRWPIYDSWRYFANVDSRRRYRFEKERMDPTAREKAVIRDLEETGISIVQLSDLLPQRTLVEIQNWTEERLRQPAIQQQIEALEAGARPGNAKSGKFYIVRPLGDVPLVDLEDCVMRMALSEPFLRIVCGYLNALGRLVSVDLWYNVAFDGADEYSQRWHRDPDDRKLVKVFLYLRDVEDTNGPFCYVPRTHNPGPFIQKIARLNYPKDGVVERKYPPNRRRICTGKSGTLIFCDTTGFHKGGHATAGARFVFNAVYATNGAETLWHGFRYFSLKGKCPDLQRPAADYAIGRVAEVALPDSARR